MGIIKQKFKIPSYIKTSKLTILMFNSLQLFTQVKNIYCNLKRNKGVFCCSDKSLQPELPLPSSVCLGMTLNIPELQFP